MTEERTGNMKKQKKKATQSGFYSSLILALSGSFRLLLALYAWLFVMLTLAHFGQNTGAGTLTLKTFERAF